VYLSTTNTDEDLKKIIGIGTILFKIKDYPIMFWLVNLKTLK